PGEGAEAHPGEGGARPRARQPARGDRVERRAGDPRRPSRGHRRRHPAHAAVAEPDRQRDQVQEAGRADTCPRRRERRRHGVAFLGLGQRHRHRAAVLRAHLHGVPEAAHPGRVPRHRDRPRDMQEGRRPPPRTDLGRVRARQGQHVPLHASEIAKRRVMTADDRTAPPVEILLVEDNLGDARLTREALKEGKVYNNLHWVKDGVEALDFLYKRGKHKDAPKPDIILLDLNLPKKDGREVLQEIKADSKLQRIPVVVLTTSKAEEDVLKTYQLHANCYVTKPVDLEQFIKVVRSIDNFWLTVVTLPNGK